jgi:hypothetical protein
MNYIYQLPIISSNNFSIFFSCHHNLFLLKKTFFEIKSTKKVVIDEIFESITICNHTIRVFLKRNIEPKDCWTFLGT